MTKGLFRHIKENLWLWTGITLAAAAVEALLRSWVGPGHHLGALTALTLMVSGSLMMKAGVDAPPQDVGDAE